MDHHRPQIAEIRTFFLRRRNRSKILCGSGIPIAVRQRLHTAAISRRQRLPQRFVRHSGIAAVAVRRILIWRAHPCRASLRRAVQKHFAATKLKMPVIPPHRFRECITDIVHHVHTRIGNHVEFEQPVRQQRLIQSHQTFRHHALLHRCNTVRSIDLLRPSAGIQQIRQIGRGNLLLVLQKGVFLHITGQLTIFFANGTTLRRRCIRRDAEQFQRQRVEHTHVPRLMHQHNGMARRYTVKHLARRMLLLGKRILVIPLADHPLPTGNMIIRDKTRQCVLNFRKIHRFSERRLQHCISRTGKMAVRIDKSRQQHATVQINLGRILSARMQPLIFPYRGDHAIVHQQCLRLSILFHGMDRTAIIQHLHSRFPLSGCLWFQYNTHTPK